MNYSELKRLADSKKIEIGLVAEHVGMTATGFKRSIDKESLPISKVLPLCDFIGISVSEFFGEVAPEPGNYASNISGVNNQNSNVSLRILSDQLKEKDQQISRLLSLLDKATGLQLKNSDDGLPFILNNNPVGYKKEGKKK